MHQSLETSAFVRLPILSSGYVRYLGIPACALKSWRLSEPTYVRSLSAISETRVRPVTYATGLSWRVVMYANGRRMISSNIYTIFCLEYLQPSPRTRLASVPVSLHPPHTRTNTPTPSLPPSPREKPRIPKRIKKRARAREGGLTKRIDTWPRARRGHRQTRPWCSSCGRSRAGSEY